MAITKSQLADARAAGFAEGRYTGRQETERAMAEDIRKARNAEITAMLTQAAALAQANAKLTYSLSLLVEKAKV